MAYLLALLLAASGHTNPTQMKYTAGSAGASQRDVSDKLGDVVSVRDYGAKGNGITDDAAAFVAACAVADAVGGILLVPPGNYKNAVLQMNSGYSAIGLGSPTVRTIMVGDVPLDGAGEYHAGVTAHALTANAAAGSSSLTMASTSGYVAGDWLLVASNASSFSSTHNWIPKFYQYFKVQSLTSAVLTIDGFLRYDFTTAQGAIVMKNPRLAVNGVIDGFTISSNGSLDPYTHFVQASVNLTIRNVISLGASAFGVSVFSDNLLYQNVEGRGVFSGLSTARGTGRVTYRNVKINLNPASNQGFVAFFEESLEDITVQDSTLIGGRIVETSLEYSDTLDGTDAVKRRVKWNNVRVINPQTGTAKSGVIEQFTAYVKNEFDGCHLEAAAGFTDGANIATASLIGLAFNAADPMLIKNTKITSGNGDPILFLGTSANAPTLQDNTYLGSSVTSFVSSQIEAATPVTSGTRYTLASAGGLHKRYAWDLRGLAAGTYTMFDASISNGQHLYTIKIHESESGKSNSYSATVSQTFNTAPTVTTHASLLNGLTVTVSLVGTTETKFQIVTTAAPGNYIVELETWYANTPVPNIVTLY